MFPTGEASSQIIKVSLDGDVRRLAVDFPAGTSSAAAFVAVGKAVKQSFGLGAADDLVMKYTDDEGDLCTLAELSMEDFSSRHVLSPHRRCSFQRFRFATASGSLSLRFAPC